MAACAKKYAAALAVNGGRELLVSGSDDFTLYLWDPANDKAVRYFRVFFSLTRTEIYSARGAL